MKPKNLIKSRHLVQVLFLFLFLVFLQESRIAQDEVFKRNISSAEVWGKPQKEGSICKSGKQKDVVIKSKRSNSYCSVGLSMNYSNKKNK